MTQDQFYFCSYRILELREKLQATYDVRKKAQVTESALADEQQVDFDSLKQFVENKTNADKNTAEAQALIKELAAQEAKIRAFVPVSLYGSKIEAAQPGQPLLYVVVDPHSITIGEVKNGQLLWPPSATAITLYFCRSDPYQPGLEKEAGYGIVLPLPGSG